MEGKDTIRNIRTLKMPQGFLAVPDTLSLGLGEYLLWVSVRGLSNK
jgi:hypothetical protein